MNKGMLIFGIILLVISFGAFFYGQITLLEGGGYDVPSNQAGMIFALAGIVSIVLGFTFSTREMETEWLYR